MDHLLALFSFASFRGVGQALWLRFKSGGGETFLLHVWKLIQSFKVSLSQSGKKFIGIFDNRQKQIHMVYKHELIRRPLLENKP